MLAEVGAPMITELEPVIGLGGRARSSSRMS